MDKKNGHWRHQESFRECKHFQVCDLSPWSVTNIRHKYFDHLYELCNSIRYVKEYAKEEEDDDEEEGPRFKCIIQKTITRNWHVHTVTHLNTNRARRCLTQLCRNGWPHQYTYANNHTILYTWQWQVIFWRSIRPIWLVWKFVWRQPMI